jgi:hypothetical protein
VKNLIVRRILLSALGVAALGGCIPVVQDMVHLVVANVELHQLNTDRGTSATLDDDPISPSRRAKTNKMLARLSLAQNR